MSQDLTLGLRIRVNNDGTVQVLNQTAQGIHGISNAANQAEHSVSSAGSALRSMAGLAVTALGGLSFGKITQEIGSFESKMINVKALTMANATEMAAMTSQARDLGATTAFSAQQAAEAQGVLASAGLKANEILTATPKILQLAAAGGLELARASEIAMGAVKGLGLGLADLGHVNDVLSKTAADTQTSVGDLGSALTQVAPLARLSDIGIDELNANLGILANNNIRGATAGDQLKSMLAKLSDVTKPTIDTLAKYGLTVADINVSSHGLSGVMHTLQNANLSVADTFQMFGTEAAAVGSILTKSTAEVDALTESLKKSEGAADTMAAILGQGLIKELDALQGAVSEAALQLGDAGLKGALSDVVTTTTGVISIYSGMLGKFAEANKLTVEEVTHLNAVANALEHVAGAAGGVGVLATAIWGANVAMAAFNATTRLNPLIAVAGLGAAAIGGVIAHIHAAKREHESFMTSANNLEDQNLKIKQQIAKVNAIPRVAETSAVHKVAEENRAAAMADLAILVKQRNAIEDKAKADKAAIVATTQQAKAAADLAKQQEDDARKAAQAAGTAASAHKGAANEADKAAKVAQKNADKVAQGIAAELAALDDQHNKLTMSERDYYANSGAVKKMDFATRSLALAKLDVNKAAEASKKADDAHKSEMDSLIDKYNQLTLSARAYFIEQRKTQGIKPDDLKTEVAQFDKNTAAETQNKQIDAATQSLDAYNQSIQAAKDSMTGLGDVTSTVLDGALGGIHLLVSAFDALGKSMAENARKQDENNDKKLENERLFDPVKKHLNAKLYAEEDIRLSKEKTVAELDGASQIAGAAARMFGEKTAAAKAFHGLEIALSVASMAMKIQEMAVSKASTLVKMAEGAATFFAQSGWLGFAGVAAMAAVMAGFGVSGGFGSSVSAPPKSSPDTGTVLGDSKAQSESIGNIAKTLKDIHASEYPELRGINKGIYDLQAALTGAITTLFQAGGISDFGFTAESHKGSFSQLLAPFLDFKNLAMTIAIPVLGGLDLINSIFSGGYKHLQEQGIATKPQTIGNFAAGQNIPAWQYNVIKTREWDLFSDSTRFDTVTNKLDQTVVSAISKVFQSAGSVSLALAKSLGGDLQTKVKNYVIPALKVDLTGLNAEDASKKLNAVLSTALDTMANTVFGKIIGKYQQLGEGMLETAARIVAEVAVVKDALRTSGITLAGNAIAISDALVQAAGGLKEFQQQFNDYYDKFYTDTQKQTRTHHQLADALTGVALVLPQTREGYRHLVESLNLSNAKDRERYTILMGLSAAADGYYTALESHLKTLNDTVVSAKSNLASAYKTESDALTQTISKFDAFSKSLKAFRDALSVGDLASASPGDKYRASKRQFERVAAIVDKGPGTTSASQTAYAQALADLQAKAQGFLSVSRDYNASSAAYKADYQRVMDIIGKGITGAGIVKTDAQNQLQELKASVKGLVQINTSVLTVHKAILALTAATIALNSDKARRDAATQASKDAVKDASLVDKNTAATETLRSAYAANAPTLAGTTAAIKDVRKDRNWWIKDDAWDNQVAAQWLSQSSWMYGGFNKNLTAADYAERKSIVDAYLADLEQNFSPEHGGKPRLHPDEWYRDKIKKIDGAHESGLKSVPFDGYVAELHKNERVLTAQESRFYNRENANTRPPRSVPHTDSSAMLAELKKSNEELAKQNKALQVSITVLQAGFNKLITQGERQADNLDDIKTRGRVKELA